LLSRITAGLKVRGKQALGEAITTIDWAHPLGCGSYGCAFSCNIPEVVIKISEDPVEAPICNAIIATGLDKELDGLARVYGAWKIRIGMDETFVIIRENIQPVASDRHLLKVVDKAPWMDEFEDLKRLGDDLFVQAVDYVRERELEAFYDDMAEAGSADETHGIVDALQALQNEGIYLWDLHAGNLATRIYSEDQQGKTEVEWYDGHIRPMLLMYDYGHSYSDEDLPRVKKLLRNPMFNTEVEDL
jgi:hypothetical protein